MPDIGGSIRDRFWGANITQLLTFAVIAFFFFIPVIPFFTDPWLRVLFLVGLFSILGFGLNIVVGFAGLLDLGYVAFFATGAYLFGLMSSPASPFDITLNFWLVLTLALAVGGGVGLLLGLPVLPLRGDYLAIVTLGFGEIVRIFLINARGITNGSQGLSAIDTPPLVFRDIDDPRAWYYFVLILAIVVAWVTIRLRDARIGRAWEAIREDEDVAAAMGINTVKYKLMAFAIGAAIGSLGGVMFASFIGFINPTSFSLQVSINVLALVVIGGLGNAKGVVLGAFILIGVPEILQFDDTAEFLDRFSWLSDGLNSLVDALNAALPFEIGKFPPANEWGTIIADKRFIIYGALLVAIMGLRPKGIFPAKRRMIEVPKSITEASE